MRCDKVYKLEELKLQEIKWIYYWYVKQQ
jgi:hypothetical protein